MENLYLTIVLSPLLAAIVAGLFGKKIGRAGAHWVTIIGVAVACVGSIIVLRDQILTDAVYNATVYKWAVVPPITRIVVSAVSES